MDVMADKARYPLAGDGYQNQPMKDGGRWIENPAANGLRFAGWYDEIGASRLYGRDRHTGWYLYPDGDPNECARGCVYQLPARNGCPQYVPAVRMGSERRKGGWLDQCGSHTAPAILYLNSIEEGGKGGADGDNSDAWGAAKVADSMAEHLAESEREYQEAWREGSHAQSLHESAKSAKERARKLLHELRRVRDRITPGDAPALCASIRADIKRALTEWAENRKESQELSDTWSDNPAFLDGYSS